VSPERGSAATIVTRSVSQKGTGGLEFLKPFMNLLAGDGVEAGMSGERGSKHILSVPPLGIAKRRLI
jgi:hypothetical protein